MDFEKDKCWASVLGRFHRATVMTRRTRRIAMHAAKILPKNVSLLDVGSGNGRLAKHIAAERPDVHVEGLDIMDWPEQLIKITRFDGRTIPFKDSEWDYCMVSDVLHHCERPRNLLMELARVAKHGVIIKDHISDTKFDYYVLCAMDWVGNRGHGVGLAYQYYSTAQWQEALQDLSLVPEMTLNTLGLYPPPLSWFFDRNLHFMSICSKSVSPSKSIGEDRDRSR